MGPVRSVIAVAAILATGGVLTGCGGSSAPTTTTSPASTSTAPVSTSTTPTAPTSTSPASTSAQPVGPENAVKGLLGALVSGNDTASCAFTVPSFQSACSQAVAAGNASSNISGTFAIAGEVVHGTAALVSITGNLCTHQQAGGSSCSTMADPSTGMPSASLSFEEAFSEAYSNNIANPTSPIPCIEVNGAWYVDTNNG